MNLAKKVALVTGGAGGIGLETCKELLKAGVQCVSVCDLNEQIGLNAEKKLCAEFGKNRATFIKTDVTNATNFEEAFKNTIKANGGLDIVVNNAGISNDKQWEKEIDINLNGVIRGTLLGLKYLGKDQQGKGGAIVNIASICGIYALPPIPMYTAAKHGVVALTRSLGLEYHVKTTGVRIMAMCPGVTTSPLYEGTINNVYNDKWSEEWGRICSTLIEQGPEYVGKGVMQMVESSPSGSVWVSEASKPIYEVKIEVTPVQ